MTLILLIQMPLEIRLRKFRELLEEKKVSASSTWEKELSKIVFDSRYLLLSAAERKAVILPNFHQTSNLLNDLFILLQAFEAYTKERSEIERAERKKRQKEAKEEFKKLLTESELHGK
jgi:transcription elongation regulator 1